MKHTSLERRLTVHTRRVLAAMLCWSALQAAATQWADRPARTESAMDVDSAAGRRG